MKDSVLLHRKSKPDKKHQHENIPDAWDAWNKTAEAARNAGRADLVEKYQPEQRAGWYTIYLAGRKLREEMGAENEAQY